MVYNIGNRKFEVKKLVLGQMQQMAATLRNAGIKTFDQLTNEETSQEAILTLLASGYASELIAVIITEHGKHIKEKDINELKEFVEYNLEFNQLGEIITNFFKESISGKDQDTLKPNMET